MSKKQVKHNYLRTRLIAAAIFTVLAGLTVLVWKRQVDHQRSMLSLHTEDVSIQAARRLEVFVESHLIVASIFAKRWSTHETKDFSKKRFEEFASVLIEELPGYYAVGLMPPDLGSVWAVPGKSDLTDVVRNLKQTDIIDELHQRGRTVVSAPFKTGSGRTVCYAVLPLVRDESPLGYLAIVFHTEALINDCFHSRIISEFHLAVQDERHILFRSSPLAVEEAIAKGAIRTSIDFPVRNRTWHLSMALKKERAAASGWTANISVPLLGFLLSVILSYLVYLLSRRMEMYRSARDKALVEIEERRKAQAALKASENRYRNVFDSSTDGLLVLHPDGRIIEANRAAGEMHGYEHRDLVGRSAHELVAPDQRHRFDQFRRQLNQHGAARLDSVDLHRDGSRVDIEVRGTRMVEDGQQRLLAIVSDVSERKRAVERHVLLSRKAIAAQEEERARLSVELHDELGQILTAIRLEIGLIEKRLATDSKADKQLLENLIDLAERATNELRRICKGLRPPLLDDLGLGPAAQLLVEEFRERSDIKVHLDLPVDDHGAEVPKEIALCAYRILQESLTNIRRHSEARSVEISLAYTPKGLEISVSDDGIGFDTVKLGALQGCGLEGMQERANLVNGTVEIRSARAQGTRIVFRATFETLSKTEVT